MIDREGNEIAILIGHRFGRSNLTRFRVALDFGRLVLTLPWPLGEYVPSLSLSSSRSFWVS